MAAFLRLSIRIKTVSLNPSDNSVSDTFSSRAVGVEMVWNANAQEWQQREEDGEPVKYESPEKVLIGHSIFYPTSLDLTKVRKGSPDGIWYWVMSLRDAFLTLKGRLEANPIDAYERMKPVVEASKPDVTFVWLGFGDEEEGQ